MLKRSSESVDPTMPPTKGCPYCDTDLRAEKREYSFYGVYFGRFEVLACPGCLRYFFREKSSTEIERIAKQKGLWGKGAARRARQMAEGRTAAKQVVPRGHGR